jgi:hypothetical protein
MLITQRARSSRAAAARLVFAPRRLLSAPQGAPASETLAEKNRRLREKSEENLTQSRQRLMEDMSKRNEDMAALREVIHEKTVTLHPPPAALYSQASAFRFPQLEATSLAGDTVILDDNLFAGKWTLFGCAGSRFAQPMVDGWMDGIHPDDRPGVGAAFRQAIQQSAARLSETAGVAPRAGFETNAQVMTLVRDGIETPTRILRAAGVQPE